MMKPTLEIHITLYKPDPLQIVFTDQPNQITIGSEVHLTCVVGGGNDPHVTWISVSVSRSKCYKYY